MATFTIISSQGSEQNPTIISVGADEWYMFLRNASLIVRCITGANTDTVIDTDVYSYRVVAGTSTVADDIIVFYDKISGGNIRPLYKKAIELTPSATAVLDSYLVDADVSSYDSVSVAAYYRLSYVSGTDINVRDYTDDLADPTQYTDAYQWPLDESMTYMYHIINQSDIRQITIYYVYNDGETHIAESVYVIMSNTITISPPLGTSDTMFVADLSNVSLTYSHLVVTPPSGTTISNVVASEAHKTVSFNLKSTVGELKTMTFSDSVDSFTAVVTYSLSGPPKVRKLGVIALPAGTGRINDLTAGAGGRAPGVSIGF